jgi:hypothetical protein
VLSDAAAKAWSGHDTCFPQQRHYKHMLITLSSPNFE